MTYANKKRLRMVLVTTILSLFIFSCNYEKDKIHSMAEQIVNYLNSNNFEKIRKIYPNAEMIDSFETCFNKESIKIESDRMTMGYKILLDDNCWFIIVEDKNGDFKIAKSRGIFAFNKARISLAEKTGWINANMSDKKIANAFKDTTFIKHLSNKTKEQLNKKVYSEINFDYSNKTDNPHGFEYILTIHNDLNKKLDGKDYRIKKSTYWFGSENEVKYIEGKDISSNDSTKISVVLHPDGSGHTGENSEIIFTTDMLNDYEIINKYYTPSINDYKEYLKDIEL